MIVLDTIVVSEMMKPSPSQAVLDWLNRQESERLHLTTVTIGQIEYGLRILPDGQRRRDLQDRFNRFVATAFALRVLSYDEPAAYRPSDDGITVFAVAHDSRRPGYWSSRVREPVSRYAARAAAA